MLDMTMLSLVLALTATGTCYMVDGEGRYIDLNNGRMCPEITAITQPPSPPSLSVPELSQPTGETAFLGNVLSLLNTTVPVYDAIESGQLNPVTQGQLICNGQQFNEAKPSNITEADFNRYQATVQVVARDRLCP